MIRIEGVIAKISVGEVTLATPYGNLTIDDPFNESRLAGLSSAEALKNASVTGKGRNVVRLEIVSPPVGLGLEVLRAANVARLPLFKNALGAPAHSKPDGSDWEDSQWCEAVLGELGEYANLHKKFMRGDIDAATFKRLAGKELADVLTYLDLLAFRLNISLSRATIDKWNEVSERVGAPLRIAEDGSRMLSLPVGCEGPRSG